MESINSNVGKRFKKGMENFILKILKISFYESKIKLWRNKTKDFEKNL